MKTILIVMPVQEPHRRYLESIAAGCRCVCSTPRLSPGRRWRRRRSFWEMCPRLSGRG